MARRQADDQLKALQCGNVENTQRRIEGQDIVSYIIIFTLYLKFSLGTILIL